MTLSDIVRKKCKKRRILNIVILHFFFALFQFFLLSHSNSKKKSYTAIVNKSNGTLLLNISFYTHSITPLTHALTIGEEFWVCLHVYIFSISSVRIVFIRWEVKKCNSFCGAENKRIKRNRSADLNVRNFEVWQQKKSGNLNPNSVFMP